MINYQKRNKTIPLFAAYTDLFHDPQHKITPIQQRNMYSLHIKEYTNEKYSNVDEGF